MLRVTAIWSGFPGSPGYTNLYFGGGIDSIIETAAEASACAARARVFFDAVKTVIPINTVITVQPTVAKLNVGSGELEDEFAVSTAPLPVTGGGSGVYAAPVGACVNWRTATIVRGRRLRGKTFLVPLAGGAFQADGSLATSTVTTLNTAANDMATAAVGLGEPFVVWARPVNGAGGATGRVLSGGVADKASVLRSRRD